MAVAAVVFGVAFVVVERTRPEPVLPLHLFRNRVFTASSAIGFVVGFAMFGALTYLPQYFQIVKGVSPTSSGLRLLPLLAGLLLTSISTGQLVSRWGRYRIFPIIGTATMTLGLYLLSHLGVTTGTALSSLYMFVLGVGLGASMQVLVIAVQNAVDYADLGVGHVRRDVLPVHRRVVRRGRVRRDLHQPARRQRRRHPARPGAAAGHRRLQRGQSRGD